MNVKDEPLKGQIPDPLELTLSEAKDILRYVPIQVQVRLSKYFMKVNPGEMDLLAAIKLIAAQPIMSKTIAEARQIRNLISVSPQLRELQPELEKLAARADSMEVLNPQKVQEARQTISFAGEFIQGCLSEIDKERSNGSDHIDANAEAKRDLITLHNAIVDAVSLHKASEPTR